MIFSLLLVINIVLLASSRMLEKEEGILRSRETGDVVFFHFAIRILFFKQTYIDPSIVLGATNSRAELKIDEEFAQGQENAFTVSTFQDTEVNSNRERNDDWSLAKALQLMEFEIMQEMRGEETDFNEKEYRASSCRRQILTFSTLLCLAEVR